MDDVPSGIDSTVILRTVLYRRVILVNQLSDSLVFRELGVWGRNEAVLGLWGRAARGARRGLPRALASQARAPPPAGRAAPGARSRARRAPASQRAPGRPGAWAARRGSPRPAGLGRSAREARPRPPRSSWPGPRQGGASAGWRQPRPAQRAALAATGLAASATRPLPRGRGLRPAGARSLAGPGSCKLRGRREAPPPRPSGSLSRARSAKERARQGQPCLAVGPQPLGNPLRQGGAARWPARPRARRASPQAGAAARKAALRGEAAASELSQPRGGEKRALQPRRASAPPPARRPDFWRAMWNGWCCFQRANG